MEKLAYGLFADQAAADAAITELERRGLPKDVIGVDEYAGEIPDEDLPGPATRSRTYAVIGGSVAAVLGLLFGGLIFGSRIGLNPITGAIVIGLGAGLLGALVSGIAGAAIPRLSIEAMAPEVSAGRVLVTIDAQSRHTTEELLPQLQELGALRAGTL
ncbi:MAG: hypothetical protein R6X02_33020 [Enhygromyxa sp.]